MVRPRRICHHEGVTQIAAPCRPDVKQLTSAGRVWAYLQCSNRIAGEDP